MSEYLFDIYQDNIKAIFNKQNKLLDSLMAASYEKGESIINEADQNIKEAEKIVKY
jgi:exonuclease VII small subunit